MKKEAAPLDTIIDCGFVSNRSVGNQLVGDCLLCGKEDHLYIDKSKGLFDCKKCGESGNVYTFMDKFSELVCTNTTTKEYKALSKDRGLPVSAFKQWGIGFDGSRWIIPIKNNKGTVVSIRHWVPGGKLLSLTGCRQHIFNGGALSKASPGTRVYLCYTPDTEVLTQQGWIRFDKLSTTHSVAAYHSINGRITYEHPSKIVSYKNANTVNIKSNFCDLIVTSDHRMLTKYHMSNPKVVRAADMLPNMKIPVCGMYEGIQCPLSMPQIQLLVAFSADGCVRRGYKIEWALKKNRKKNRLRNILKQCNIKWDEKTYKGNQGYIYFTIDKRDVPYLLEWCPDRVYSENILEWDIRSRKHLIYELSYWDGDSKGRCLRYFTSNKQNADIISRCAAISDYGCIERKDDRDNVSYVLNMTTNAWRSFNNPVHPSSYTGDVHCCTVSTGMLVVRRNGKAVISGNCEGEWDAIAMAYVLKVAKLKGIVAGIPGANTFKTEWKESFADKNIVVLYDNDGPGDRGSQKVYEMLNGCARSLSFIHWPENRPSGYDVRDLIAEAIQKKAVRRALALINKLCEKLPRRTIDKHTSSPSTKSKSKKPISWDTVMKVYRKWLYLDEFAEMGLKVVYATVLSSKMKGDPCWLFLVGPPGGGKTTMILPLKSADCCVFESSITERSLISGFKSQSDPSLIPKLDGKVLVLKDYTEILSMNSVEQEKVYSILRGAFDGHAKRTYGNGEVRSYNSMFSIIAAVTNQIHGHSKASLGERFLKFELQKHTSFDASDQIRSAMDGISKETAMEEELGVVAEAFTAMDVSITSSCVPRWFKTRVTNLVQLIALLRAEVDREAYHDDRIVRRPQHEVGTRLAKQLVKLGMALCALEGKNTIDDSIYRIIVKVAIDTSIAFHSDILVMIMAAGGKSTRDRLVSETTIPSTNMLRQLDDLVMLNIVTKTKGTNRMQRGTKNYYSVTERVAKLWNGAKLNDYLDVIVTNKGIG